MPQMSSMGATYHEAKDLIYALQNPSPASALVKKMAWTQGSIEDPS